MRLHSLSLVAFGPFPDLVEIDFDALNSAGVFLLSGATGAGKTSVLDAIAFALYGEVPGDRNLAKRLRSDLADPLAAPEVSVEFSVGPRRLRITRSPAWQRAKRRGSGVTTIPAKVACVELVQDSWVSRSTRIDEVAHLVTSLLGLTHAQFCQVVILPQGRFQAFLRAGADDRRKLLQRLFHTDRFAAVEAWFGEHRRATRREADAAWQRVEWLSGSIASEADCPAPEEPDGLLGWATECVTVTQTRRVEADSLARSSREDLEAADAALARARTLNAERERFHSARVAAAQLEVDAPEVEQLRARLSAASAARAIAPLLTRMDTHAEALATAERRAESLLARAGLVVAQPTLLDAGWSELGQQVAAEIEELARARPLLEQALRLEAEQGRMHARVQQTQGDHQRLVQSLTQLQAEAAATEVALADARAAALQVAEATHTLDRATADLDAARRHHELTPRLRSVTAEVLRLGEEHVRLRDEWLDMRERRLAGIAGELAGALAAGCGCPVCGSTAHPNPASASPGSPDLASERAAQRASEDAEVHYRAAQEALAALAHQSAVWEQQLAGRSLAELTEAHAARADDLELLSGRAAPVLTLEADDDRLTRAREEARIALDRTDQLLHRLTEEFEALQTSAGEAADQLGSLPVWCAQPGALSRLSERVALLSECQSALSATQDASLQSTAAVEAAHDAAKAAGFGELPEARDAVADIPRLHTFEDRVSRHDRRAAEIEAVLADPRLAEVLDTPRPDLEALQATQAAAARAHTSAVETAALATDASRRLGELSARLSEALAAWLPAAAAADLASSLSGVIEGKHPDNQAQLRLSEFVLAHRLGEVVAAANLRLSQMTDHRYELQHVAARRGGLTLEIVDGWSGQARDPATLSGGESFVVSLALALGLADVIAAEAGATPLDTLFVDEGFGSLDPDTLSDVLDTVDGLREGGRVVGLVSHVPEMRARIPTRLHIDKRRHGSSVRLVSDHHA